MPRSINFGEDDTPSDLTYDQLLNQFDIPTTDPNAQASTVTPAGGGSAPLNTGLVVIPDTSQSVISAAGFLTTKNIMILAGISVIVFTYLKRVKIKSKYNDAKESVKKSAKDAVSRGLDSVKKRVIG